MGIKNRIDTWLTHWYLNATYNNGKDDIEKRIRKIIKNGRLRFTSSDSVVYLGKDGIDHSYNFNQFAMVAIEVGGWKRQMDAIGLTVHDVKEMLIEEYKKSKKEILGEEKQKGVGGSKTS